MKEPAALDGADRASDAGLDDPTDESGSCCEPALAGLSADCGDVIAGFCRTLSDPQRVRIMRFLVTREQTVCVCDLATELGRSQPTTSYHLKKLMDAGLLDRQADGKWACYTPTPVGRDVLMRLELIASACEPEPVLKPLQHRPRLVESSSPTRKVIHAS
jgi:ArsR family transcriptional regulator